MTRKQLKGRIAKLEYEIRQRDERYLALSVRTSRDRDILLDRKAEYEEANQKLQRELDFEKLRTEFLTEKVRELLRRSVEVEE
jgi:hypothetical protein